MDEQSLGKKATDHLRRMFLRQTSRRQVRMLEPGTIIAPVNSYLMADAFRSDPGAAERSATSFDSTVRDIIASHVSSCKSVDLVSSRPVMLTDGLAALLPRTVNGGIGARPITTSQALFVVQTPDVASRTLLGIFCNAGRLRLDFGAESITVTVHLRPIRLVGPRVLAAICANSNLRLLNVVTVPESIQARVPLVRARAAGPGPNALTEPISWTTEKDLLAAAAGDGVSPKDVQVIGVFRHVPLLSASKIEIGPGPGNLSIYLRSSRGNVVQSARCPMFSIAFGRVRGRSEILRVLIPE